MRSLTELGSAERFHPPDFTARAPDAPAELAAAVVACLSPRPEERPPSAAAFARRLASAAREPQTLSLPADPAGRGPGILEPRPAPRGRRRSARLLAAAATLAAAAVAGAAVAVALTSGSGAPAARQRARPVAPPAPGSDVAQQARNLAAWLERHSR